MTEGNSAAAVGDKVVRMLGLPVSRMMKADPKVATEAGGSLNARDRPDIKFSVSVSVESHSGARETILAEPYHKHIPYLRGRWIEWRYFRFVKIHDGG